MNYKLLSLSPLLLFVVLFILSGILLQDFYAISSVVWILVAIVIAFVFFKGSFEEKFDDFLKGMSDKNILMMCLIFLFSGAFTSLSKQSGSIDYITYLLLEYVPSNYILVSVFLLSCILSFALGTSVGTIVALGPIIYQMGQSAPEALPLLGGALLGGAMFGDNLSFISDTTIAVTQTMEVKMKDKFKANAPLALIAAIITCIVLANFQYDFHPTSSIETNHSFILLIPYVLIIGLALMGYHVIKVLILSIISAFVILMIQKNTFAENTTVFYKGLESMTEITFLSLFIGGLIQMITSAGGIDYLVSRLQKMINGKIRRVPFVVALLVSIINMAVANNTIALLISGTIANKIANSYTYAKAKLTSILDIFACIVQGIIPYGAQVLILLTLFEKQIDYLSLIQNSFYIWFLMGVTFLSMFFLTLKTKKA